MNNDERQQFRTAIQQGLNDIKAGRVLDARDAFEKLQALVERSAYDRLKAELAKGNAQLARGEYSDKSVLEIFQALVDEAQTSGSGERGIAELRQTALERLQGSVKHFSPSADELNDGITPDNTHPSWDSYFDDALHSDADFLADREQVFDPERRGFETDAAMQNWLQTPNIELDSQTPAQAIQTEAGRARVITLLQQLASKAKP